ncbi:MAG: hypothetical protein G01um101433_868 [Parcubacteria group bacterium Gr01-1014_33]|nr:MAG: hypothetical protein G01um101433_868 [Parcubacteria group bacterium Gr01-1014_33]
MKVNIYSIQSTLFEGDAEKLICVTQGGQITVLDNHLPIITTLIGPSVRIAGKDGEKEISLAGGVLEVRPGSEAVILASSERLGMS